MKKEQLVSLETATLLKKINPNIKCEAFYGRDFPHYLDFNHIYYDIKTFGGDFFAYAPTQTQLQTYKNNIIFI